RVEQLEAGVGAPALEVRDHGLERRVALLELLQGVVVRVAAGGGPARRLDDPGDQLAGVRVIVDHEHPRGAGRLLLSLAPSSRHPRPPRLAPWTPRPSRRHRTLPARWPRAGAWRCRPP